MSNVRNHYCEQAIESIGQERYLLDFQHVSGGIDMRRHQQNRDELDEATAALSMLVKIRELVARSTTRATVGGTVRGFDAAVEMLRAPEHSLELAEAACRSRASNLDAADNNYESECAAALTLAADLIDLIRS